MNNKILVRLRIIKNNEILEVYLDSRLSFKENFKLLGFEKDYYVYETNKGLFLDRTIPINEFNIEGFMAFNLY